MVLTYIKNTMNKMWCDSSVYLRETMKISFKTDNYFLQLNVSCLSVIVLHVTSHCLLYSLCIDLSVQLR